MDFAQRIPLSVQVVIIRKSFDFYQALKLNFRSTPATFYQLKSQTRCLSVFNKKFF